MIKTNSNSARWRTVDLITLAILAVALGTAFWGYDSYLYPFVQVITAAFPPAAELQLGVWILPAAVGLVLVRKPGAALFAELIAANVELLLGNTWGVTVIISALLQAAGLELVYLFVRNRKLRLSNVVLGAALSALFEAIYEVFTYVPDFSVTFKLIYLICGTVSGALLAGVGGWYLVRALGFTGAINVFVAGREAQQARASKR
jgi:energy-coupling factor transport system substrate-specific component